MTVKNLIWFKQLLMQCIKYKCYRYIIFHVLDYDDADDNESMGQVIIDLNNFDPDSGYHGNFQLADMVSMKFH